MRKLFPFLNISFRELNHETYSRLHCICNSYFITNLENNLQFVSPLNNESQGSQCRPWLTTARPLVSVLGKEISFITLYPLYTSPQCPWTCTWVIHFMIVLRHQYTLHTSSFPLKSRGPFHPDVFSSFLALLTFPASYHHIISASSSFLSNLRTIWHTYIKYSCIPEPIQ